MHAAPPQYVRITAGKPWTEEYAQQLIDTAKAQADAQGLRLIYLDLRVWKTPDHEMVRYASGAYLAKALPPPYRVVACAPAAYLNRFAETVAVNRFAWFRVFTDEPAALHWLLAKSPSDASTGT